MRSRQTVTTRCQHSIKLTGCSPWNLLCHGSFKSIYWLSGKDLKCFFCSNQALFASRAVTDFNKPKGLQSLLLERFPGLQLASQSLSITWGLTYFLWCLGRLSSSHYSSTTTCSCTRIKQPPRLEVMIPAMLFLPRGRYSATRFCNRVS